MSSWSVARVYNAGLAVHCLDLAGYQIYLPRLRVRKMVRGRRLELQPALFPGYIFVQIQLQWHTARWSPGIVGIIMDGDVPAKFAAKRYR
jgi:transcriptional antiterminator RfaH